VILNCQRRKKEWEGVAKTRDLCWRDEQNEMRDGLFWFRRRGRVPNVHPPQKLLSLDFKLCLVCILISLIAEKDFVGQGERGFLRRLDYVSF